MARADKLQAEDVLGPINFAQNGYPHEAWKTLREEAPLRYFDLGPRPGFWAVVKRADIVWLSKQPNRFVNAPRVAIFADSPPPDPTRPNRAGGRPFPARPAAGEPRPRSPLVAAQP